MAPNTARHLQSRTTSGVAHDTILNNGSPGSQRPRWQRRKDKTLRKLRQIVSSVRNSLRSNHIRPRFWRQRPQKPIGGSIIGQVEAAGSADKMAAPSLPPPCVNDPICSTSISSTPDNASSADARNSGDVHRDHRDHISTPPITKPQAQVKPQSCPHSPSSAAHGRNKSNHPVPSPMQDQSSLAMISDQVSHGATQPQSAHVDRETMSSVKDHLSEMPWEPYLAPPGQQVVRIKSISSVNPDPRISQQGTRPVSLTTTSEGSDDEPLQYIVPMAIHKPGVAEPEHTTPRRGLLDTGSGVNVVSQKVVDELNMMPWYENSQLLTLGDVPFRTIGVVIMRWHVDGRPEKTYNTKFLVIPRDIECAFDFLIGLEWIRRTKALIPNHAVFFLRHTQ
jgi:hypothetical protein